MKVKRQIIILGIETLLVALGLALTVVTYAWYTANTRTEVGMTQVTAAAGVGAEIVWEEDESFLTYMGQDGTNAGSDAPYNVTKSLQVRFTPLSPRNAVQIRFLSVDIDKASGADVSSASDPTVLDEFTWRIEYGGHVYRPDENGYAYRMVNGEKQYVEVNTETTLTLDFKLIYLGETSYLQYEAANYEGITPFAYSGYPYMRAVFSVVFEIAVDPIAPAPEPEEPEEPEEP